ncbi:MAG: hypothetical protein V1846_04625 [Candidatus Komeilibacteria bacterium]
MKLSFKPQSRSGQWAIWFALALAATLIFEFIFALAIRGNLQVIEANFGLEVLANILSIIFTLSGPLSLIFGIYTVIKHKDWSVAKILALIYLITIVVFLLGEFSFPH